MRTFVFTVGILLFSRTWLPSLGQQPSGFRWISSKSPSEELTAVTEALKVEKITEVERVGLIGHHALVFTSIHDTELDDHQYDYKPIYDVDNDTKEIRLLVSGHRVRNKGWLNLDGKSSDLAITYQDCSECEPASLFTAFHYVAANGWNTRWKNATDPLHPGIWFLATDVGEPYEDEEVNQVFAVVPNDIGIAEPGRWYRSRNLKTHKVSDDVMKCSITADSLETCTELHGRAAKAWEIQLCRAKGVSTELRIGQQSKACEILLAESETTLH